MENEFNEAEDHEGLEDMKPVKNMYDEGTNPHNFDPKERVTYELMSVDS